MQKNIESFLNTFIYLCRGRRIQLNFPCNQCMTGRYKQEWKQPLMKFRLQRFTPTFSGILCISIKSTLCTVINCTTNIVRTSLQMLFKKGRKENGAFIRYFCLTQLLGNRHITCSSETIGLFKSHVSCKMSLTDRQYF